MKYEYILPAILGFATLAQWMYYLLIMGKVTRIKPPSPSGHQPPVSVIVCAKNEADNLQKYLPAVLNQNYPEFQVVVVNDCSEDHTELYLAKLKEKHPHLYYTTIPVDKKFFHGKKLALTIGIKAAKYEHLVLLDADCTPASVNWLAQMVSEFSTSKQLILGYGRYAKHPGLLNRMIRYETFWNAVQYMGFALAFRPFMGVGRNMAYTKTLFQKGTQFRKHLSIASGDDDLFVMENGTKTNTAVVYRPESQTVSQPETSLSDWISQKARHLNTAPQYPVSIQSLLSLEIISRQLFWISGLLMVFFNNFAPIAGGLIFIRLVTIHWILFRAANRFHEKDLCWMILWMDILTPWLHARAWMKHLLGSKKKRWR